MADTSTTTLKLRMEVSAQASQYKAYDYALNCMIAQMEALPLSDQIFEELLQIGDVIATLMIDRERAFRELEKLGRTMEAGNV